MDLCSFMRGAFCIFAASFFPINFGLNCKSFEISIANCVGRCICDFLIILIFVLIFPVPSHSEIYTSILQDAYVHCQGKDIFEHIFGRGREKVRTSSNFASERAGEIFESFDFADFFEVGMTEELNGSARFCTNMGST